MRCPNAENAGSCVMADMRSLVVQSILFQNPADDIARALRAVALSARKAVDAGFVSRWEVAVGDSSPDPVFDETLAAAIAEEIEAAGGRFRYEYFAENLGHGGGHNRLAPLGNSDLLLILNPDALVAPDTISELVKAMSAQVGAADGRQIPIDHPKEYDAESGSTSWASGACLMTTRAAFDAVGGFDSTTFFLYCDDVDYSWRVRLGGFRVVHAAAARVFHDKRMTATGGWPAGAAELYYSAEAALLLAHKYSRPDIVKRLSAAFRKEASDTSLKVLKEFDRRKRENELPAELDAQHRVSEFVHGNYATHRF
jgi:GT2 family glycosyltransferase